MIKNRIVVPVVIFVVLFAVYALGFKQTTDSVFVVHTAMSIIKEGDTDLDEYENIVLNNSQYKTQKVNGHIYSSFPEGTSLVAVPICLIIEVMPNSISSIVANTDGSLSEKVKTSIPFRVERLIASLVVAMTAVVIYLIGELFFDKKRYSFLLVFIFAFCTSAWSIASRALWQHGPSMLMLSVGLYLILLARNKPGLIQYASIPLAFAYVIRPTNSIPFILLSIFVFIEYRSYLIRYLLWALAIAIPFIIYNVTTYSSILPPYYQAGRLGTNEQFVQALAGNLVSPNRGLLIFVPVVLISLFGIVVKVRQGQFTKLDFFLVAIILTHWVVISMFDHWWGGWSYGPRFFTDMMPFFTYFFIPILLLIPKTYSWHRWALFSSLFVIIVFSVFVHAQGALRQETLEWNAFPENIDESPSRIWDWRDPQFYSF